MFRRVYYLREIKNDLPTQTRSYLLESGHCDDHSRHRWRNGIRTGAIFERHLGFVCHQTPTSTFTPTVVIPTATRFVPSDTPTPTLPPTRGAPITYTVVAGDTFTSIGQKFSVDVETLIAYNKLASTTLGIGQQLVIPPSDFVFVPPTTTPIPTNLRPGTYISYTIKAGDILGVIAEKFNSRSIDIINANKQALPDPNNIPVGTTIRIPYNSIFSYADKNAETVRG